ncbi:TetR/AcrR family transcriptional regulator (plasmid) [Streptomyces xanthophaeus]|uniref:TetR/AcrR family transcriptional regulator n=1 Tax=Streptomyces xanthophaeus TaxID=67385 RepID=UPI002F914B8F|nr:TetR/AcrR family transcriptional regulator [Streptomyces xanthophaeus]WST65947.1 TetR/AcrR family transcriptional regulator [Streptomyces xanthophaeus]
MSRMPSGTTSASVSAIAVAETGLGLRERKKMRTRHAIREAARLLIDERGYDSTTVEQIAAAAEVSPSTVFRYFPSKEHIVLTDDYAQVSMAFLRERPADELPLAALRAVVTEMVHRLAELFSEEYQWRRELVRQVPAIRALVGEAQDRWVESVSEVLAERAGLPADNLEIRVLVGAVLGAFHQVLWGDHSEDTDLVQMIERALGVLEHPGAVGRPADTGPGKV